MILKLSILLLSLSYCYSAELPTLYEYYTSGGIKSGLKAEGDQFTLNGKPIRILGGSFHYFRVHQHKWRDVLRKFKAAGLNAVQLYSPWNLHEELPDKFDFESGFLNITDFFTAIKEADMFAMFRPGPYICAEWENGGYPAWTLRDPNLKVRSNYKPYMAAVEKYWAKLFAIAKNFQFTTNGGPIIAMQIENEFGSYGNTQTHPQDVEYLKELEQIARKNGIKELLFTSDPWATRQGTLPEFLETINFNANAIQNLDGVRKLQPNKPLYVAEFWTGWFDNPGGKHHTWSVNDFATVYEQILFKENSSANMYMFIGGTNFGFMNGAGIITSYDYDAPLSESGNYTTKYWKVKEMIERLTKERNLPKIRIPEPPKAELAHSYGVVKVDAYLTYSDVLPLVKSYKFENPIHPELINIGPNYGQNYGFTVYRTTIPKSKTFKTKATIGDRAAIVVDDTQVGTVYRDTKETQKDLPVNAFTRKDNHTLDLVIENTGRWNGGEGMNHDRKGISGDVLIDDKVHNGWQIIPLEFKSDFISKLKDQKWRPIESYKIPSIYRAKLEINESPRDTYLRLDDWHTAIVIINGFNLGRYWNISPAKTLYVPAPVLRKGSNDIYVFETFGSGNHIEFVDKPSLG